MGSHVDGTSLLIEELSKLSTSPPEDEGLRRQLSSALTRASLAIESPLEAVRRLSYAVSLPSSTTSKSPLYIHRIC